MPVSRGLHFDLRTRKVRHLLSKLNWRWAQLTWLWNLATLRRQRPQRETPNMRSRFNLSTALIASAAMSVVYCLAAIRMTGQADATKQTTRPARASDRHPDLNGIWQATTTANWDL